MRLPALLAVSLLACTAGQRLTYVPLTGPDERTRYDTRGGTGNGGDNDQSAPFADLDPIRSPQSAGAFLTLTFRVRDDDGLADLNVSLMHEQDEISRVELPSSAGDASIQLPTTVGDGWYIRLRVSDRLGFQTVVDSNTFELAPDTQAPPAPMVTWITQSPTAQRSVHFVVTQCEANTQIQLADTVIGALSAWRPCETIVIEAPFTQDGTYSLVIFAKDEAGNVSPPSAPPYGLLVDATPPGVLVAVVAPSGPLTNAEVITFTVSGCEGDLAWALDRVPTSFTPCPTLPVNVPLLDDGPHLLQLVQRDSAGLISPPFEHTVTRDRTPPLLALTTPLDGSFLASGTLVTIDYVAADLHLLPVLAEYSIGGGPFAVAGTGPAGGPILWDTTGVSGADVVLRVTAIDGAGNTSTQSVTLGIDATPPTVSALRINGDATTSSVLTVGESFVGLAWSVSDDVSGLAAVCIKRTQGPRTPPAPLSSDACWQPIASFGGTPGALAIDLPVVPYAVKTLARLPFRIFVWSKDRAGRVSANSATIGEDTVRAAYDPGPPPVVTNVFVMNTDTAPWPLTDVETTGAAATPIFVKWSAAFPNNTDTTQGKIDLQYTTDDVVWTTLASNLANTTQGGCTLTAPDVNGVDASANFTGCYVWSATNKPTGYYTVRVVATDRKLLASVSSATPPMNAGPFRFLAGNTDPGIGGSSLSTFFDAIETPPATRNGIFAVTDRGTLFYVDKRLGLFWVDPTTASSELLLHTDADLAVNAPLGDGGDVRNAVARDIDRITVDSTGRVFVTSRGRIRMIDVDTNGRPTTITTIIGGGVTTIPNGTIAATSIDYNCLNCPVFALRDGTVWAFQNQQATATGFRMLRYDPQAQTITAITPTGTGWLADGVDASAAPIDECHMVPVAAEYNPQTSVVDAFILLVGAYGGEQTTTCGNQAYGYGYARVGPNGQTVAPWPARAFGTASYTATSTSLFYSGLDGKVYAYFPSGGGRLFVRSNGVWQPAVGSLTYDETNCADGTAAFACNIASSAFFSGESGEVFWFANGRLRSLDLNNDVITIAGTSAYGGSGGPSLSARIAAIHRFDLWNDGTDDRLAFIDVGNQRVREATINGALVDLTGDGTPRAAGPIAPTMPLDRPFRVSPQSSLAVEPTSGDVYLASTDIAHWGIVRYSRANTAIEHVVGCAEPPCTMYYAADAPTGPTGPHIAMYDETDPLNGYGFVSIVGLRDGHLLTSLSRYKLHPTAMEYRSSDGFMKYYRLSDLTQHNFVGRLGFEGPPFVADALPRSDHDVGMGAGGSGWWQRAASVFDAVGSRWIHQVQWYAYDSRVIGLPDFTTAPDVDPNDTAIELLDNTGAPAELTIGASSSLAYRRDGGKEYIYYCYDWEYYVPGDPKNHRLFVRNLSDPGVPELELPWPIESIGCRGFTLLWNASRNSLMFAYSKGSLFGIAEYADPPTP